MSTGTSAEFFTAFQSARREIDDDLKRSSTVQGETVTKLQSLKADLARHIASLPAYVQRSCTLQLNELEAKVSAARNQAKPKSRFAFARSTAASAAPSSSSSISTGATPTPDDPLTGGSGPSASGSTTAPSPLPSSPASRPDNVPTTDSDDTEVSWTDVRCGLLRLPSISTKVCISLSNISDSIIDFRTSQAVTASTSIGPSAPGTPGRAGADSETVGLAAIPGPLRARDEWTRGITSLHVQGLKRCILIAGVEGSAILHGLEDCLVVVASHQFRIHSSHRTAILLHTPSVPIIEHSDTLYFGALPSHLREESNNSQHEKVQDFDWVKGGPSPNWRALGSTASEMLFPRDEADAIGALTHDEVGDAVERMVGSIADLVPIDPSA